MWMVGNWFRSDHSCLAMGQEYNQKLFPVHTPSILHDVLVGAVSRWPKMFALSAWAHMGCYNYCGGFVCVVVVMYVALQCAWVYLVFFIFCCKSGRGVIGVLLSYLHALSLSSSCFWLFVFFLHHTSATSFFSFAKVVLHILCQFHKHSSNQVTKCHKTCREANPRINPWHWPKPSFSLDDFFSPFNRGHRKRRYMFFWAAPKMQEM